MNHYLEFFHRINDQSTWGSNLDRGIDLAAAVAVVAAAAAAAAVASPYRWVVSVEAAKDRNPAEPPSGNSKELIPAARAVHPNRSRHRPCLRRRR